MWHNTEADWRLKGYGFQGTDVKKCKGGGGEGSFHVLLISKDQARTLMERPVMCIRQNMGKGRSWLGSQEKSDCANRTGNVIIRTGKSQRETVPVHPQKPYSSSYGRTTCY